MGEIELNISKGLLTVKRFANEEIKKSSQETTRAILHKNTSTSSKNLSC